MASSGSSKWAVTEWDWVQFNWSLSSQSVANNQSVISWNLKLISGEYGRISSELSKEWSVTINGTTYSGTNSVAIGNNTTKTLASGTTTIKHNADGTKAVPVSIYQEFYVTFGDKYIIEISKSLTFNLDTIARKSTVTASNGTLGIAQTLTINRQSSDFTHTITYTCGTASGTIVTKTIDTSVSFIPPLSLASQNTTGTTVSITFTVTTYSSNTTVGSNTKTISCSMPEGVKPSCSISVSDPMSLKDTYGYYIKGYSKFAIALTTTTSYSSDIASYKVVANGKTYTSKNVTTDVLTSSGTLSISATVTDKRGRTATASASATVKEYSEPIINQLKVKRCDANGVESEQGEYVQVTFSATATSLDNKNTVNYKLEYKPTSLTEYTVVNLSSYNNAYTVTDATYIFAADTGKSYDIKITVTDAISEPTTKTTVASTASTMMHFPANGKGLGLGKITEFDGLDIGFLTRFSGGIMPVLLIADTDLNDVRTPNIYYGENVMTNRYLNCPIASGTFVLEVAAAGGEGQMKQRFSFCSKDKARVFERYYYYSAWGEWVCVSDFGGTLLWQGGFYMQGSHKIALSEPISKQPNGIVLVFSRYSSEVVQDYHFNHFFVHKAFVGLHPTSESQFLMSADGLLGVVASKCLYIRDTEIEGHDNNTATGTSISGITYDNKGFVLRYVIGV